MTLIAGFRCYEGVVLCADQQETVGGVRVSVNKMKPELCGEYWLAIAGTGNGDLIDGFAYRLKLDLESWPEDLDNKGVYGRLQALVQQYHENEVAFYPTDSANNKLNHFLVCIKPKVRSEVFLWELRGTAIVSVGDYTLLGIDESIYRHELKRLYQPNAFRQQVFFLAVHLFTLAKETSNYVGGSIDVIFIEDKGMGPLQPETVRTLEDRMSTVNGKIAEILLACPDTGSVDDVELEGLLENFREEILRLRQEARNIVLSGVTARTHVGTLIPSITIGSQQKEEDQSVDSQESEEKDKGDES